MSSASWIVRGVRLDEGSETELAIADGCFAGQPAAGAEILPGRFVLAGLVDAHVHVSLDLGGSGRAPGSAEVVADSQRSCLRSGVLLARDAGAPVGVRVGGDHGAGYLPSEWAVQVSTLASPRRFRRPA